MKLEVALVLVLVVVANPEVAYAAESSVQVGGAGLIREQLEHVAQV